jgi:uncharacterized membrane protein
MKTSLKISILLVLVLVLFVRARYSETPAVVHSSRQVSIALPADVKAVVDNKCYGCHSVKGMSAEAKEDLMWDSIPLYDKDRQIAVLDDIGDVVAKGDMPPEKFVQMHPEAKLTADEVKLIRDWAESTADELMK